MPVAKSRHADATLLIRLIVLWRPLDVASIRCSVRFCISHRFKRIKTCHNNNSCYSYYTILPYRDVLSSGSCMAQNAVDFIIFERTQKNAKIIIIWIHAFFILRMSNNNESGRSVREKTWRARWMWMWIWMCIVRKCQCHCYDCRHHLMNHILCECVS